MHKASEKDLEREREREREKGEREWKSEVKERGIERDSSNVFS